MDSGVMDAGWVSRGHGAIPEFELVRAKRIADALSAYKMDDDHGAAYIAGGIDQINRMQDGDMPDRLIDISNVQGLSDISEKNGALNIGARVTHYRMETDPVIASLAPDLAAAWATFGNIRIRMAGTVGGNVMARHPNYDGPVLLAAFGARYVFEKPDGTTSIIDAEIGPDDAPGALLTRVVIPTVGARRLVFDRSLKPVISVAVATDGNGAGRAALGCAFSAPVCVGFDMGGDAGEIADDIAGKLSTPIHDAFAGSDYRRRMARVLLERQIIRLAELGA
jgi:aerobic carbon-monoxide dehydrogenase medium subunit